MSDINLSIHDFFLPSLSRKTRGYAGPHSISFHPDISLAEGRQALTNTIVVDTPQRLK